MHWYLNARLRLTRISDQRPYNGWAEWLSTNRAEMWIQDPSDLAVGDELSGVVHGVQRKGEFSGTITSIDDAYVNLEFARPMQEYATTEDARVLVEGLNGYVALNQERIVFRAQDMNAKGLGILVGQELPRRSAVKVVVVAKTGMVQTMGQVRHCRKLVDGNYIAGLCLDQFDRLEQARWNQIMMEHMRTPVKHKDRVRSS